MALTQVTPRTARTLRTADDTDSPANQLRNFLQDGGVIVSRWELTRHAESVMRACRGLVAIEDRHAVSTAGLNPPSTRTHASGSSTAPNSALAPHSQIGAQ